MQNASPIITALNDPAANDQSLASVLLESAAKILKPLVRLWITHGVTYQMASELLKRVYVDTAREHFVEKDTSDTRLSLLTGINRKEIRRLCREDEPRETPDSITTFAGAIDTMWRSNDRYRDDNGEPCDLTRRSSSPQTPSFDELVRSISTDHRPSAVLHELCRLGIVEVVPANESHDELIRLMSGAFVPRTSLTDRLLSITKGLQDHGSAAISNVLEDDPRFLERYITADELSPESAQLIHQRARSLWKSVNEELVQLATECEVSDAAKLSGSSSGKSRIQPENTRIGFGMYFFSEQATPGNTL